MFNYKENYNKWLEDNFFDEETREELSNITDEKEIEDRFYRDLEFGTGGLRGVMGAGTNRMNKYTIGKATKGLGMYLLDHYGVEACAKRGVVIGYDTRNNSKDFSEITANVLTGMGIKVYLHSEARPTPQLSFSVKFLNALAGVVITASHNPKEYNGYKVYAHVLAPKNIIEKLVLEIPVNISQMSALTCGRTCKKVGIDRNRLSQQGIVLVCGQECKDNGNQERNCNFLCKWFCVKNENLIKELAALKEYLNRNKNNYFKSAIEIRIKCNDRTSLDARQFEILNEYIGKM